MKYHQKVWCLLLIHCAIYLYAVVWHWSFAAFAGAYALALLFQWLGNECGLHRLWAHRAYKTQRWKELTLHLFAVPLLYGTPLTYACVHRHHHANSDTERDSHVLKPWWKVVFYLPNRDHPVSESLCMDLLRDPVNSWVHKHYFHINWGILIASVSLVGFEWTGWVLSAIVVHNFVLGGLINVLGHKKHPFSSKAHATGDNSCNSALLQVMTLNQGLHNNHHRYPGSWTFSTKRTEVDVPGWIIGNLLKV